MPRPHTLKTIEVFASVQGEGLRQGEPTIFVRLSGCNRKCSFCDTKRAWEEGDERPISKIIAEIDRLRDTNPSVWVCLTGGEPLAQEIGPLVRRLHGKGFRIQVETNGTYPPVPGVDWFTVSPKPPDYEFHPGFVEVAREVKLVACRTLTLNTLRTVRVDFPPSVPVILQPQSNARWSMKKAVDLLRRGSRAGLRNVRISLQLHKIYGLE